MVEGTAAEFTDTDEGRLTGADEVEAVSWRFEDCCLDSEIEELMEVVSSLMGAAGVRPKLPNCNCRLCSSLSEGNSSDGKMTGTL